MSDITPRTSTASIVLNGALLSAHEALLADLERAAEKFGGDSAEAADVAERLIASEATLAAAEQEYVFQAMGRGRWRKMKADHPPQEHQAGAHFDLDEFPIKAMAASIVTPALTEDEIRHLVDEVLDEARFQKLWLACLDANLGEAVNRPESAAARFALRTVRHRSKQPSSSESDEAG